MTKKKKSKTPVISDHSSLVLDVFVDILHEDFVGKDTKLVGAIDQGTSSTRFVVFTQAGRIGAITQLEHEQLYPRSGWHEHDCAVLWQNTAACITAVARALKERQICELSRDTMAAIGITNQRETTLAWNRSTGRPYHNAIVWDDTRTADIANQVTNAAEITKITGLPISSYFAGTKVKWLLDHVEQLRNDLLERPEEVCFGTVDVWLLYQLTGQVAKSPTTGRKLKGAAGELNTGGVFKTDVSNASRWLFMDLETCSWNESVMDQICAPHKVPLMVLPEICPSSHIFGEVSDCGLPASMIGIPLASVLGDQQAALFGQTAFAPGDAKNTYGTGLFLMMNTGTTAVRSTHGLLTTVAFQLGNNGPVHYALEGSVSHSGSVIQWLRDQLNMITDASESETLARTVVSNEGLYFVPAFAGLFAPHWRFDARGTIVGITARHTKGHICRAALEAAAFQTKEVFDAILKDAKDAGVNAITSLKVDGGGTNNKLLMQFQADILDTTVIKPVVRETTSMGAAFAAGLAVNVWKDLDEISKLWAVAETFQPKMTKEDRNKNVLGWEKAISRSLGWVDGHEYDDDEERTDKSKQKDVQETSLKQPELYSETKIDVTAALPESGSSRESDARVIDGTAINETDGQSKAKGFEQDDTTDVTFIGDVSELNGSRNAGSATERKQKNRFGIGALALTAGTALGVGIVLGSSRRR